MIDYELFSKIKHLKEHEGLSVAQIALELAIDPRTVKKMACPRAVSPPKGNLTAQQARSLQKRYGSHA